jgi:hypothetical protein
MIKFDASTHTYTINGVRVPSVTQVLKAEGVSGQFFNQDAAKRGTLVHHATAQMDKYQDITGFPEEHQGYLDAYMAYLRDELPTWERIEEPVYLASLNVCGTPDRINYCQIVDIKTGNETPADAIQLAGYAMIADVEGRERWNLYLHADGTYDLVQRTDAKDFIVFRYAVFMYYWKLKHGVTK